MLGGFEILFSVYWVRQKEPEVWRYCGTPDEGKYFAEIRLELELFLLNFILSYPSSELFLSIILLYP